MPNKALQLTPSRIAPLSYDRPFYHHHETSESISDNWHYRILDFSNSEYHRGLCFSPSSCNSIFGQLVVFMVS